MAEIEKSKVKKMNNPYFDRWQSVFSDLAHKCSLMCMLEKECLETPIRIPPQVWDDTDSLESEFMSKSIGEVIETIDRIYDGLYNARYGETDGYEASTKKSVKKSFSGDFTESEIKQYCPNATRIWDNGVGGIDVIWDLPSGNHPGIYISSHGSIENPLFVAWMTANRYLDYQEPDTPDGNLPYQFEALDTKIHDRVEEGNSHDTSDRLPTKEEVIAWLREMDRLCAERMNKSTKKSKPKSFNEMIKEQRKQYRNKKVM